MADTKKDVLYALQTSRGIVTFDDPSELQPWLDKGMNRFDLIGPPQLEEIEVDYPELIPKYVWVGVDWKSQECHTFMTEAKAAAWYDENDEGMELQKHEVMV